MPRENVKDLQDIPKRILKSLRLVPVAHMDEVLRVALVLGNPSEFLKEPSVAVDWRIPSDRRERNNGDRRDSSIPVASAVPPPEPAGGPSAGTPGLQTTVVPIDPGNSPGGGRDGENG
jgi:hypothetical protein